MRRHIHVAAVRRYHDYVRGVPDLRRKNQADLVVQITRGRVAIPMNEGVSIFGNHVHVAAVGGHGHAGGAIEIGTVTNMCSLRHLSVTSVADEQGECFGRTSHYVDMFAVGRDQQRTL